MLLQRSENMPWYTGKTLLEHLETVDVTETEAEDRILYAGTESLQTESRISWFPGTD